MGVVFHVSCLQYLSSDTLIMCYSLKKLEHYGVRGIVLNYLPWRKQYVSVNGHTLDHLSIPYGVPPIFNLAVLRIYHESLIGHIF